MPHFKKKYYIHKGTNQWICQEQRWLRVRAKLISVKRQISTNFNPDSPLIDMKGKKKRLCSTWHYEDL